MIKLPTEEEFFTYIEFIPECGCWIWTGPVCGKYGALRHNYAHRISFNLFVAEVRTEDHILHTCNTKLCVNPRHLYLGNHSTNAKDFHASRKPLRGRKLTIEQVQDIKNFYITLQRS